MLLSERIRVAGTGTSNTAENEASSRECTLRLVPSRIELR